MKQVLLKIEGMTCSACSNGLEKYLNKQEGISDSAAIVIFFIKLGRYLDRISKDKTKEAIQKLVQITPNKAIIKKDGQ